jgi:predicted nucleic acid-binding protein
MQVFLDTSATVPLILLDPHSEAAAKVWAVVDQAWAWNWMRVEAEAALTRRRALPESWKQWRSLSQQVRWLEPSASFLSELCAFNRSMGLRSADAGHLFVCDRVMQAVPSLILATFDKELRRAADRIGIPVLPAAVD